MNPATWIALAYGIVAATLLSYTIRLKRRLRRAESEGQKENTPRVTHPSAVP